MKRTMLLSAFVLLGTVVYAVNMPTGPVTVTPSGSAEGQYKKNVSTTSFTSTSTDVCPSYYEYKGKLAYYQQEAKQGNAEAAKLAEDKMLAYNASVKKACKKYFDTAQNPDCERVLIMYMIGATEGVEKYTNSIKAQGMTRVQPKEMMSSSHNYGMSTLRSQGRMSSMCKQKIDQLEKLSGFYNSL